MGKMKAIGKGIAKACKWAYKHSKEIGTAAKVGFAAYDEIRKTRHKNKETKPELEESGATTTENTVVYDKSAVLAIANLEKRCEEKWKALEELNADREKEIFALSKDVEGHIQELRDAIETLIAEQEKINKKQSLGLTLISVIGGVGIVAAIILAIVL